jgi:hypothetical protein
MNIIFSTPPVNTLLILICLAILPAKSSEHPLVNPIHKSKEHQALLDTPCTSPATVGVIPVYKHEDGKVYILLGRERAGSDKKDAGTYADFGGKANMDGSTLGDNILREFHEETMNQLPLTKDELVKRGYLITVKNPTSGRFIIYVFIKLTNAEFQKTLTFNDVRKSLPPTTPQENLEKDEFTWFDARSIITWAESNPNNTDVTLPSLEGEKIITIRKFTLNDCFKHPQFSKVIKALEE